LQHDQLWRFAVDGFICHNALSSLVKLVFPCRHDELQ
jgi:hypothetical protein